MHGVKVHKDFQPSAGCECESSGSAITFSAGDTHGVVYAAANAAGLQVPVAGAPTVSYGGYVTGAGHSAMGATHGLAADLVQEMQVVLPSGQLVTANKCQNTDLFWALRGGGPSYGVITQFTISAPPAQPATVLEWAIFVAPTSKHFWDIAAYATNQFTTLIDAGIMGYGEIAPQANASAVSDIGVQWIGFNKTAAQIQALLDPIAAYINQTWPGETSIGSNPPTAYATFYDYWAANPDHSTPVGIDLLIASRLLDKKALSNPKLSTHLQTAGVGGLNLLMVAGPGVHNQPKGLNAVLPAWRTSYIHMSKCKAPKFSIHYTNIRSALGVEWAPFDTAGQLEQENLLTNTYLPSLIDLAPDTGSYVNEADPYQADFRKAFWGVNYPRLLAIKRTVDPTDLLWCIACVGNERWHQVGGELCQV